MRTPGFEQRSANNKWIRFQQKVVSRSTSYRHFSQDGHSTSSSYCSLGCPKRAVRFSIYDPSDEGAGGLAYELNGEALPPVGGETPATPETPAAPEAPAAPEEEEEGEEVEEAPATTPRGSSRASRAAERVKRSTDRVNRSAGRRSRR